VHAQHVGGSFDHLVQVGVVERIPRRLGVVRLAAESLRCPLEIVHASAQLALLEGSRNRDFPVRLDSRRPELVVEMYGGKRNRLNRIVVRWLLRPCGKSRQRHSRKSESEGNQSGHSGA
jgi:hypothetical protein